MPAEDHQNIHWVSPSHPHHHLTAFNWREITIRVGILVMVAVFFKLFLFAAAVIAFIFVMYAFSTIEPTEVEHHITKNGIKTAGVMYVWEELQYCYFSRVYGQPVLNLVTVGPRYTKLELPLGDMDEDELRNIMEDYLPVHQAPAPTLAERASVILARLFAFE